VSLISQTALKLVIEWCCSLLNIFLAMAKLYIIGNVAVRCLRFSTLLLSELCKTIVNFSWLSRRANNKFLLRSAPRFSGRMWARYHFSPLHSAAVSFPKPMPPSSSWQSRTKKPRPNFHRSRKSSPSRKQCCHPRRMWRTQEVVLFCRHQQVGCVCYDWKKHWHKS